MSQMKELYEKVSRYSKLQEKFSRIVNDSEKVGIEETKERLIAFAHEHGYDVTIREMQSYFEEIASQRGREMTEAELDMVAGGKNVELSFFSKLEI